MTFMYDKNVCKYANNATERINSGFIFAYALCKLHRCSIQNSIGREGCSCITDIEIWQLYIL